MSNRLKDIFTNEEIDFGGNIIFKDKQSYEKFLSKLSEVNKKGTKEKIKGVSSINTHITNKNYKYPYLEMNNITDITIEPSIEKVRIDLYSQPLEFFRYEITNQIILEMAEDEIVRYKLLFKKDINELILSYKLQPQCAETISDIIESYKAGIEFLDNMFLGKKEGSLKAYEGISNIKKVIIGQKEFYKRLDYVVINLNIDFNPKDINEDDDDAMVVNILYLLLNQKRIIRRNITKGEEYGIIVKENNLEVGQNLEATFVGKTEYKFYNQKGIIYTTNLLSNAIIKKIEQDNGGTNILYTDTDRNPMYISYTGFVNKQEAMLEQKAISDNKAEYIKALTLEEHLDKFV